MKQHHNHHQRVNWHIIHQPQDSTNDLEDKEYVMRTHNRENRRQVYISITDQGRAYLETMIGELIHEVLRVMQYLDADEKEKMDQSVVVLSELFRKDADICRKERDKAAEG